MDDCAATDGFSFWAEGSMWSPDGRYLAYRRGDCSLEAPGTTNKNWGDVVISRRGGQRARHVPRRWMGHRVVARFHTRRGVGHLVRDGRRLRGRRRPAGPDHDAVRWQPAGDHDPAWLRDGTLVVDAVELPLDGGAARTLDQARVAECARGLLRHGGPRIRRTDRKPRTSKGRSLMIEGSDGSGSETLLTVERGTSLGVIGFSPEGDRILFERNEHPQAGGDRGELWSVRVDGSDTRLVVAGTVDGDWFVPSVASDDIPEDPPVESRPAPGALGTLAYVLDGDVYVADPDGLNAVKIADGRPLSDCQGTGEFWAEGSIWSPDGHYLAYRGADCDGLQEGAGGRRDHQRRGGQHRLLVPGRRLGHRVVAGLRTRRGVGQPVRARRSASTGSTAFGRPNSRCRPGCPVGGDYDPMWVPDGTSLMVNNMEVPLDGSTPRQLPLPVGRGRLLARRIAA